MPIAYNHIATDHVQGLIAIIDIGSNSVRMVIYHALKRVPLPVFNEKYMCALGKGLARTGRLNPEGVESARKVIARFLRMAERMEVARIDILATAAVRDAEDGAAFAHSIEQAHGVNVQVISGEQEARYAALGIIASIHAPLGISADLGGGSMELSQVFPQSVGHVASTPLGGLRIADSAGGNIQTMQRMIDESLDTVPWLTTAHPPVLYAIGGGFRAIAKLHMRKIKYPLDHVHEYVMPKRAVLALADQLTTMQPSDIAKLPGASEKRAATLGPTAMVLQSLLQRTKAKHVMFSVSGIREGFFYDQLSASIQKQDALIASATDLAALIGRKGHYAKELYEWMSPLFHREPIAWARVRMALCILSEIAWSIDPNFRGPWAYQRIVHSSLKGMDHHERIMLGLALFHRYQTKWKSPDAAVSLLSPHECAWARCVGLAANVAFQLSGGKAGNLYHASLQAHDHRVVLTLDAEASPLRTETVEKKLDGLGEALSALASLAT
jgi:exopolyphosphatase / guanosine-5'-triphosphate,3'-diphosphate pyrophosphatase